MKYTAILLLFVFTLLNEAVAQTADEIIDNYFETIGGKENWKALDGIRIEGTIKMPMNGMNMDITIVQLKDGRQFYEMDMQGMKMKQNVFDGEKLWGTNFMSQKPELTDAESTKNFKVNQRQDFPDPFLDYKDKGYRIELLGKEIVEGTETYKIVLHKNPISVDGVEEGVMITYYFDTESFVPIAVQNQAAGGMMGRMRRRANANTPRISTISDYQEIDGLYFAFSRSMGMGEMNIKSIELNPKVEESEFIMN